MTNTSYSNNPIIQHFLQFLNHSPTSWHAITNTIKSLQQKGFHELTFEQDWTLQPNTPYFIHHHGSALCAFITPTAQPKAIRLLASHSDSPALKLKPQPEIHKQNLLMVAVEIYGAPLLSSWLNRDLGLAGRIVFLDSHDQLVASLIDLKDNPFIIPQLAIHLDREVNEKGLILNKQEHLNVLVGLENPNEKSTLLNSYLDSQLKIKYKYKELLSHDLFFYPLEPTQLIGNNKELLAGYRLDNLASLHASQQALLQAQTPLEHDLKMIICWDHEEIGSNTHVGASSPFLSHIFEWISSNYNFRREDFLKCLNNSLCLSIDLAHALQPNYPEKHDPQHQPLLGKGPVLKSNAQHRYATNALSAALLEALAKKHHTPLQKFVSRNDIPCGTTIGPIFSSLTGMLTVDLGCGELSMHSCREIMSCEDHIHMCQLLNAFFDVRSLPSVVKH